jgi:hypothetical protein
MSDTSGAHFEEAADSAQKALERIATTAKDAAKDLIKAAWKLHKSMKSSGSGESQEEMIKRAIAEALKQAGVGGLTKEQIEQAEKSLARIDEIDKEQAVLLETDKALTEKINEVDELIAHREALDFDDPKAQALRDEEIMNLKEERGVLLGAKSKIHGDLDKVVAERENLMNGEGIQLHLLRQRDINIATRLNVAGSNGEALAKERAKVVPVKLGPALDVGNPLKGPKQRA